MNFMIWAEGCIFGVLSGPKWSKQKPRRRRDESRRPPVVSTE